jgi:hypothetical protein
MVRPGEETSPGGEIEQVRAEDLIRRFTTAGTDVGQTLRFTNSHVIGLLDLRGRQLPYRLEFEGCRFDVAPDLRQARLADCRLTECRLPGLEGRGLRSDLDVSLVNCRVSGTVDLRDGEVGGVLDLHGSRFDGADLHALLADRLRLAAGLNGTDLKVDGRISIPGIHTGGNVEFAGASLYDYLIATGAQIGGDLSLRGADIGPGPVLADRVRVLGYVDLSGGFRSSGAVSMVNAHVDGDVDGRGARIAGQVGLTGLSVRGSVRLDGVHLGAGDGNVVIEGRRVTIGGNLTMRGASVSGSVLLPEADVGANLDLRTSRFVNPGHYPWDQSPRPSIDLDGARIGRDLVMGGTHDHQDHVFAAHGEVRLRRAEVGRQVTFQGAKLGSGLDGTALDATGLTTQDLLLDVATAPIGRVILRQARCATFRDNDALWSASGYVDLEDFRYDTFDEPVEPRHSAQVEHRLSLLRHASGDRYQPSAYDQLASTLRRGGNELHATTVQVAKQRRRYVALAESYRLLGPLVLLWSLLQRWVVGYGFRPFRSVVPLLLVAAGVVGAITTGTAAVRTGLLIGLVVVGCVVLGTSAVGIGHRVAAFALTTSPRAVPEARYPLEVAGAPAELPMPPELNSSTEQTIAVEAYLDTNDPLLARAVCTALDDVVELLGYERPEREFVQRGSWWRRASAKLKAIQDSEEIAERRIQLQRALDIALIEGRQAEVDVKAAEAAARLISSLDNVAQGCLRAGSVLVVKYQGDDGPVILSRTLSPQEIRAINRFPEIQTKPRHVIESLVTAVSTIGDTIDPEPSA